MHVDTDSQKLKADQTFIGWAWSKMGVLSLVTGLKTVSQNLTDGIDFFSHTGTNSGKLKVDSMILSGPGQKRQ